MKLLITKKAFFGLFRPAFHHFRHFVVDQLIQMKKCKWSLCCYLFIYLFVRSPGPAPRSSHKDPKPWGSGRRRPGIAYSQLFSVGHPTLFGISTLELKSQLSSNLYLSYLLRRTLFRHNFVKASFQFWTECLITCTLAHIGATFKGVWRFLFAYL